MRVSSTALLALFLAAGHAQAQQPVLYTRFPNRPISKGQPPEPVTSASPATSAVRILVVADERFRDVYRNATTPASEEGLWIYAARTLTNTAFAILEKETERKFEIVDILPWDTRFGSEVEVLPCELVELLKKDFDPGTLDDKGANIILALSYVRGELKKPDESSLCFAPEAGSVQLGFAPHFNRYVSASDYGSLPDIIVHEIGHIFGGVHVKNPSSYMCTDAVTLPNARCVNKEPNLLPLEQRRKSFDETNQKNIRTMLARLNLEIGAESIDQSTAKDYSLNLRSIGANRTNPLATAFQKNGKELFDAGKYEEAASILQRAISLNPSDCLARFYLGRSYEELGDTLAADTQFGAITGSRTADDYCRTIASQSLNRIPSDETTDSPPAGE